MRERPPDVVCSHGFEELESANRRLIRASLSNAKAQTADKGILKRRPSPEQTYAEEFYYIKQMKARTSMVAVLKSGEVVHGVIAWYDQRCIKLIRSGQPNLLIMKHAIRYLYKQSHTRI